MINRDKTLILLIMAFISTLSISCGDQEEEIVQIFEEVSLNDGFKLVSDGPSTGYCARRDFIYSVEIRNSDNEGFTLESIRLVASDDENQECKFLGIALIEGHWTKKCLNLERQETKLLSEGETKQLENLLSAVPIEIGPSKIDPTCDPPRCRLETFEFGGRKEVPNGCDRAKSNEYFSTLRAVDDFLTELASELYTESDAD